MDFAGTAVSLPPPAATAAELPAGTGVAEQVRRSRADIAGVLDGRDDRLLVVVGPCSIHDPEAARTYAGRLRGIARELGDDLLVVMRTYFEKPRTTVGWAGLLTDPDLDGTADLARGLRTARRVLLDVAGLGLPAATEWLHPLAAAHLGDLVGYGAIGARTVESQIHRQLASALPMPVGMKNGTGGSLRVAVDAVIAAGARHTFPWVGEDGSPTAVRSRGNPDAHVILRGGADGPNYDQVWVNRLSRLLRECGLPQRVVIDASHGNSGKSHARQQRVAVEIAAQLAAGATAVRGVMLESFLLPGRQDAALEYGRSITDACMGWDDTADVLRVLASAVRARRRAGAVAAWMEPTPMPV
ncbi:3-deoxy-7-phosphoheptulonate synthase [Saccharopolyspora taberi]|uniref:Phospho-2-dehydro-3-deoxyheptonate aldolase n=1 Tax=Saccharopolyspora taberi TaxID=60895 RepID=A0ABN3VBS1_9PSEU